MCKENKNSNFIQQFIFFRVSLRPTFRRVPWHMRVVLLTEEPLFWRGTVVSVRQSLLWKRRNCWMKSLNHVDYFNNVLTTFLCLECGSSLAAYAGSESSWISSKNLNLHPEDERTSYRGWVINDRSFIFGWTIPLRIGTLMCYGFKWPAFYLSKRWVGATSYLQTLTVWPTAKMISNASPNLLHILTFCCIPVAAIIMAYFKSLRNFVLFFHCRGAVTIYSCIIFDKIYQYPYLKWSKAQQLARWCLVGFNDFWIDPFS